MNTNKETLTQAEISLIINAIEDSLNARKKRSIKDLLDQSKDLQKRYQHARSRNQQSLPDWTDHCTETYLDNLETLSVASKTPSFSIHKNNP